MTKARVQEIMTGAYDQDRLASFYCNVFGMKVVWRRSPTPDGSRRGLFLSDGYMVLCIQQAGNRGGHVRPEGLQGIGMVIDDLGSVDRLAERYGAPGRPTAREHSDGEGYVDADVVDPLGILVNLTTRGFAVEPLEDPGRMPPPVDPRTLPDVGTGLRSVAFEAADVGTVCSFYRNVFDLDVLDSQIGSEARASGCSLSDGRTALWCEPLAGGGDERTPGRMARIGFVVESTQLTLQRAEAAGAREVSPGDGESRRTIAYVVDPVGVRIDVSEHA